jgi:hypothetical protein
MRTREALALVRRHGYLNLFTSMSDTWYEAHRVAGGLSRDAVLIPVEAAGRLIEQGLVVAAQDDDDWQPAFFASAGLYVLWFTPAKTAKKRRAADAEHRVFPAQQVPQRL